MHIFPFEQTATADTARSDSLIIFLGSDVPDAKIIDDAYLRWTQGNVPPPTTLIIGEKKLMEDFWSESFENGYCRELPRLYGFRRANKLKLAGFENTGNIISVVGDAEDFTEYFYDSVSFFVGQQIEYGDVVVPAPIGTYFEKLSGRYSSHFIRTESLLQSTSCIEMLALRLLQPFNEWFSKQPSNLEVAKIYIDTMGVWPIAEKLRQFHSAGRPAIIDYQIESFRSYDGLATWQPIKFPSFVIISASTSNGLANSVCERLGRKNSEIWTLLTLAPDSVSSPDDVFYLNKASEIPRSLKGNPTINGLRDKFEPNIASIPAGSETISIVGERFLSQPARPKRVKLVHTKLDAITKRNLSWLARHRLAKIGRGRHDGYSRWTLSFDLDRLINSVYTSEPSGGASLLKNWLRNYSAPSPVVIVYLSSDGASAVDVAEASKRFAELVKSTLLELSPGVQVFLKSSDSLSQDSNNGPSLEECSVIVTAPIIGNGFAFKQISAVLRLKQPTGPRLFLALAVLSESANNLSQLTSDVASVAAVNARYDFKYKIAFSIGRLDSVFGWNNELQILRRLDDKLDELEKVSWISERIATSENLEIYDDRAVFLPSFNGTPLALSTGFFLWENSSDIEGEDLAPAVLLTIAALLQSARSSMSKSDDTSLRSGIFQHALICPDTFTRFNDPVIQAAILRAAYQSELNYSVSPEMSYDMTKLILKWLRYYKESAGSAAPEFLMAIALGKLKLAKKDINDVLAFAEKNCDGWVRLLAKFAADPLS